jgi:uncharacterized protein
VRLREGAPGGVATRYADILVQRLWTRFWQGTRDLWARAKREHSTPREVGWSVAVGVFCGCSPFVGLHMWIALALATALRLNRLWAVVGSRVSMSVFLPWIAFSEIEIGHRLRAGAWMALTPDQVRAHVLDQGWRLFGDWLLGSVFFGATLAALLGACAFRAAHRWQRVKLRKLEAPLLPPSGSRPSTPPAPTS